MQQGRWSSCITIPLHILLGLQCFKAIRSSFVFMLTDYSTGIQAANTQYSNTHTFFFFFQSLYLKKYFIGKQLSTPNTQYFYLNGLLGYLHFIKR